MRGGRFVIAAVLLSGLAVTDTVAAPSPASATGPAGSSSVAANLGGSPVTGFLGNDGVSYTGAGYTVVDIDGAFTKRSFLMGGKYVAEGCFGATPATVGNVNLIQDRPDGLMQDHLTGFGAL